MTSPEHFAGEDAAAQKGSPTPDASPFDLDAARARIRPAYDIDLFRQTGHALVEQLAAHLGGKLDRAGPVLPWQSRQANLAVAREILHASPRPAPSAERFQELFATLLARGMNLHHPRYIGHQVPPASPLAAWFDALASATNTVMAIYEMGPFATAAELALIEELGGRIGFAAGSFTGLVTSGGSLANLTALLTARNVALGDAWQAGTQAHGRQPVLVAHAEAHYCIARSAGILGLGARQVVKCRLDAKRRIEPQALEETLSDLRARNVPIVAVAASACATPIGAFDPLVDLAAICQKHDVWLHVDAAHGGAACLSRRYRHLVAGLDQADSLIWDAHKMLFVPALCAFVFYRDRRHQTAAFEQDAPYIFDADEAEIAEFDTGLRTIECTKRAAVFGLWGLWSLFGPELFADLVDLTFSLGRVFYEQLRASPDFTPLHEPECNIVVFRYTPPEFADWPTERVSRFQKALRHAVIESGEFYLVPAAVNGVAALRTTIMNPLTTASDLEALLACLREHAARLLAAGM